MERIQGIWDINDDWVIELINGDYPSLQSIVIFEDKSYQVCLGDGWELLSEIDDELAKEIESNIEGIFGG